MTETVGPILRSWLVDGGVMIDVIWARKEGRKRDRGRLLLRIGRCSFHITRKEATGLLLALYRKLCVARRDRNERRKNK